MFDVHSKLIDLTAIAELLAKELNERGMDDGPSVVGVADHLAEQLAELRDRTDRPPSRRGSQPA